MKRYKIFIPGKDVFIIRMGIDEQIAKTLYKIIISILEINSLETTVGTRDFGGDYERYQLFWYVESFNGNLPEKFYYCTQKEIDIIHLLIRKELLERITAFGNAEQLKGTDLLYLLNNGKITPDDFTKRLQ